MYVWMLDSERKYHPNAAFLEQVPQLEPNMRTILFDWMMEVMPILERIALHWTSIEYTTTEYAI
jgi:hypothetical protein